MNTRKVVFLAVIMVAMAAITVPLVSFNAGAGTSANVRALSAARANASATRTAAVEVKEEARPHSELAAMQEAGSGRISDETLKALGIKRLTKGASQAAASKSIAKRITRGNPDAIVQASLPPGTGPGGASPVPVPGAPKVQGGGGPPLVGQPLVLNEVSALSAALLTTIGGRDNQFSEVALIADWDGREDCAADRGAKIDDFSFVEPEIDQSLTRTAISEVTFANGHLLNAYYYGDSVGNLWYGFDIVGSSFVDVVFQANIPAIVNNPGGSGGFIISNPTAGDCMDDQAQVTGIAVNPVADLGDFGAGLCGVTGEVIYVSTFDSEGCASNAAGQPIRTRIFAFAQFNIGGTVFIVGNVRQILRSRFANVAGLTVDDDGSLYYQLLDLIQFTGGAIFKATELCRTVAGCSQPEIPGGGGKGQGQPGGGGNPPRINRVIASIPDPPTLGSWVGTTANPVVISGGSRHTNYGGGSSTMFANVVSLASGGCNVLYAAVSRSFVAGDVSFDQLTQGLFPAPSAFAPAGTPSMVISFADCSGAFDVCSGEATGSVTVNVGGILPVADGFADVAQAGLTRTAGVNNFRIFVQGNGPNLAPPAGGTAVVPGTPSGLLKIDMQIDYTGYSGLAVNEQNTVFVISGGTPAGIGKNPSPMLGEVLCFEDGCPADRRADFVDLRGDTLPNPPASGGNVGDGDSDRFDHIFYQAPLDQLTLTPAGLAGLADGFLRYTNRLALVPVGPGVTLGQTGGQPVLGDDDTAGPIIFEALDPGHQVAGGDDQNTPFRGDDDNGAGSPALVGPREGGFEYVFGGPVGTANCVWNGFFWNSNGNITFGGGDTDFTPTVPEFRNGLPRIAPAWSDLNPASRNFNLCTFPVQALGFANVNAFKIRWINVPQFGDEGCTTNASNTFSITLFDDGTGIDENASQPLNPANPIGNNAVPFDLQEGPTDLRFTREPNTQTLVGCAPRPEGSGIMVFDYCRMDLLGTEEQAVITGYSIGGLDPLNPPGLCEINLSTAAALADTNPFRVLTEINPGGSQTANICANCCIGEGTEPTLFELFNGGRRAGTGSGGEITFATPDFDLRFEGNDAALCSALRQRDLNRGRVCLLGVGCAPPANPLCQVVVPGAFANIPTTTGLVNALCAVQLNLVGCGFFPNETTVICQGFTTETGVPLQRNGKTVTTAATLVCDTDGNGVADATIVLGSVTPVSCNLVRTTLVPLASRPGTAFPDACCGGNAVITITTTFTAGDNNVFGPFTRTSTCTVALGTRAPVVFSVTPSDGNCGILQDLLISGACFCFTQANPGGTPNPIVGTVTSVIFQDRANSANRITIGLNPSASGQLKPLTCQLLDAEVNFTSANAGKTFLVFVVGTGGTSRNLTTLPAGAPAGCPLGNEQGFQVTFTCASSTTPGPGPTPDIAVVTGCKLDRAESGAFFLDVTGTNIKEGAAITVGGVTPKKIKVLEVAPGTTNPTKLRLKKKVCNGLPGNVIITNPGSVASQPFNCTERCPAQ